MSLLDDQSKWHSNVNEKAIMEAVGVRLTTLGGPGFCLACGLQYVIGLEPDTRERECEACGENEVFAAEELLVELPL